MSNIVIIEQPWGGLGDNLQYSTLPEQYSKLGIDVYISSDNKYRNTEIFDLVWKLNPYVKGVIDLSGNAGACKYFDGSTKKISEHSITNIELAHGIHLENNKYPKIYYTPKVVESLYNVLLYDFTSVSKHITYEVSFFEKILSRIIKENPHLKPMRIKFNNIPNRDLISIHNDEYIINNIFEYCDAIASCKVFLSPPSGNANLASAIKQDKDFPKILCIHDPRSFKYEPGDNHWYSNRVIITE